MESTSQMVPFADNLALNKRSRSDIVYFDFDLFWESLLFVLFINHMFLWFLYKFSIVCRWHQNMGGNRMFWRPPRRYRQVVWSIENKTTFNPSKCNVLSVTLQRNMPSFYWHNLNEILIDYVASHNDLGVIMTNRFLWGTHCTLLLIRNEDVSLLIGARRENSFHCKINLRTLLSHFVRSPFDTTTHYKTH